MLVVFVMGSIDPKLLGTAKRVKKYRPDDFDVLRTYLGLFQEVVLLPNTVTEAANLLDQMQGRRRDDCLVLLAQLTAAGERYVPSSTAANHPAFMALGLTDAAILCALQDDTHLLTADWPLFLAAKSRGHEADYFGELR